MTRIAGLLQHLGFLSFEIHCCGEVNKLMMCSQWVLFCRKQYNGYQQQLEMKVSHWSDVQCSSPLTGLIYWFNVAHHSLV